MYARRKYTEMDSPKYLKQDTEGKWGLNCIKTNGGFRGIYICIDQLLWFLYIVYSMSCSSYWCRTKRVNNLRITCVVK
jgi:hypothetical protein